ncbi:MAG: MOSC domain-containing protein [Actinomycetales bacterium]
MTGAARVVATHLWPAEAPAPESCEELTLDWGGPVGDRHHGLTMASDTRQADVFPRGTTIRNHRQASVVDIGELATIAVNLGLERLDPGVIADNICTSGIPELTSLPPMTRLVFGSGAVLMLGGENLPCVIAGGFVHERYGVRAESFPKAAMGLRGVTGWVEHPGVVRAGDQITVRFR